MPLLTNATLVYQINMQQNLIYFLPNMIIRWARVIPWGSCTSKAYLQLHIEALKYFLVQYIRPGCPEN